MGKIKSKVERISFFTAGGLMMVSALLFRISDIGTVFALCLAAAGLCFFAAGFSTGNKKEE